VWWFHSHLAMSMTLFGYVWCPKTREAKEIGLLSSAHEPMPLLPTKKTIDPSRHDGLWAVKSPSPPYGAGSAKYCISKLHGSLLVWKRGLVA